MADSAREVVRDLVERFAATTGRALHSFDRSPPQGEDFLRRLLRHLPGMAYRRRDDPDWTMEFVSQGCRALTGFAPEDLIGDAVVAYTDLIHPDDRQSVRDAVDDAIVRGGSFQIGYRIRRVDGRERRVWEQGSVVVGAEGRVEALEGFICDITDQIELATRAAQHEHQLQSVVEQSLRRQQRYHEEQKMEALSRLSAGIAHDLNNFLALIRTTAELAMLERPGDGPLARDLSDIMAATERGTALSRQLMHFGRTRSGGCRPVALAAVIRDAEPGLERMLGPEIELQVAIEPDLPEVPMDPTHAEEILMNLVMNARDAMPNGGALMIELRRRAGSADRATVAGWQTEHLVMEVTDTGHGIEPHHLAHVFEPYFTTKGDEGTGLGLANVWRIVTDAGGAVEVDSQVGIGTTFRVSIPVLDPTPECSASTTSPTD